MVIWSFMIVVMDVGISNNEFSNFAGIKDVGINISCCSGFQHLLGLQKLDKEK